MTDAQRLEYIDSIPACARGFEARRVRKLGLMELADDLEASWLCHLSETGRLSGMLDTLAAGRPRGLVVTIAHHRPWLFTTR